jgi:hypothetical protein
MSLCRIRERIFALGRNERRDRFSSHALLNLSALAAQWRAVRATALVALGRAQQRAISSQIPAYTGEPNEECSSDRR